MMSVEEVVEVTTTDLTEEISSQESSTPTTASVVTEQCSLCSAHFEKPHQSFARPFVNNLICKILKVQPPTLEDGSSYLNQFIPICTECSIRVTAYDKKRIELDVLGQEIVSSVLGTLLQIRPYDKTPLDPVKNDILYKWGKGDDGSSWIRGKQLSYADELSAPIRPRPSRHQNSFSPKGKGTPINKLDSYPDQQSKGRHSRKRCRSEVRTPSPDGYGSENSNQQNTNDPEDGDYDYAYDYGGNDTKIEVGGRISPRNSDPEFAVESESNNSSEDEDEQVTKRQKLNNTRVTSKAGVKRKVQSQSKSSSQPKIVVIVPEEKKEPHFCENCGQVFSQLSNLSEHVEDNSCEDDKGRNTVKECPICPMDFPSDSPWVDLKSHIDQNHGKIFLETCGHCKKEFLPNTIMGHNCPDREPEFAANQTEFPCRHCGNVYRHVRSLKAHIRQVHEGKPRVHKMAKIEEIGGTKVKDPAQKSFKCEICNRGFSSVVQLDRHKISYHKPSDLQGMFRCDICGIGLRYKKSLTRHLADHLGIKEFACEICGKEMNRPFALRRHMLVHTKEKNIGCVMCGKNFNSSSQLKAHNCTAVHKKSKPVEADEAEGEACPLCPTGISFSSTRSLKKHMTEKHDGTDEQIEICARLEDEDDPMFVPSKLEISLASTGKGNEKNLTTQKMLTRHGGKRVVGTSKEVQGKSGSATQN